MANMAKAMPGVLASGPPSASRAKPAKLAIVTAAARPASTDSNSVAASRYTPTMAAHAKAQNTIRIV